MRYLRTPSQNFRFFLAGPAAAFLSNSLSSSTRLRAALSSEVSTFTSSTASDFPPGPAPSACGDPPSDATPTPPIAFFVPLRPPSLPSLPFLDGPCWMLSASGSGDDETLAAFACPLFFFPALASPSSGSGEGDGDGDGDGVGDSGGDGDGVGDGDPLASPMLAFCSFGTDLEGRGEDAREGIRDADLLASPMLAFFFFGNDFDGRGEDAGEGVGEGDPLASPRVSAFSLAADLDGRGEGSGEGVGEAVGASSSVAFFIFSFCLALSWAVRATDELAVGRVISSGSLTSDAVVSSSFSVSRFMACWRWAFLRHLRTLSV